MRQLNFCTDRRASSSSSIPVSLPAHRAILRLFRGQNGLSFRLLLDFEAHFPEAAIMHGPRWAALFGLVEHTAHHRGALTIYSYLLGLSPPNALPGTLGDFA